MYSAQSKEGAQAAADIKLIDEDALATTPERKDLEHLPSAGVKALSADEETVVQHKEFDVVELPDDEDRNIKPDKDPADMNKAGSFEMLLRLGSGGMVSSG